MKKCILTLLCLLFLAGCGQTIVLLPDLDGHVGEVAVTPKDGGETVNLTQANQAVTGKNDVHMVSDEELQSTFGEALAAQPEPTAKFILHFLSDSAQLTEDSKKLIPDIMESYRNRVVIGHTDRVGEKDYNYALSMKRAQAVKDLLVKQGMPEDIIQTTSHGEENPLIPTPDGKAEPRNRRVEVLIR